MNATAELALSRQRKKAFDLIELRRTGRRPMDMPARPSIEPDVDDNRRLVGRVVVDHQMVRQRNLKRRSADRSVMRTVVFAAAILLSLASLRGSLAADDSDPSDAAASRHLYYTGGVHTDAGCTPAQKCIYERKPGEPTDPLYPAWWSSDWIMYRVFQNFEKFAPPYASPPAGLTPADYEASFGSSYYNSTYVPPDRDGVGAMMEYYDKRCLPIMATTNHYSCAFISLGNKTYFLRYGDRLPDEPQCCLFALNHHPASRDFIKHLPYNAEESLHVRGSIQAYSRLVPPGNIRIGYAFNKQATPDTFDRKAAPYRHPQSFYFPGNPVDPPNAPVVSQNYTNFRMEKPDPDETWNQVAKMCPVKPQWCCIFSSDCPDGERSSAK